MVVKLAIRVFPYLYLQWQKPLGRTFYIVQLAYQPKLFVTLNKNKSTLVVILFAQNKYSTLDNNKQNANFKVALQIKYNKFEYLPYNQNYALNCFKIFTSIVIFIQFNLR